MTGPARLGLGDVPEAGCPQILAQEVGWLAVRKRASCGGLGANIPSWRMGMNPCLSAHEPAMALILVRAMPRSLTPGIAERDAVFGRAKTRRDRAGSTLRRRRAGREPGTHEFLAHGPGKAGHRVAMQGAAGLSWEVTIEWSGVGAALFGVGMVAGFVDAIAGGGGLLTVPALLSAGLPPQVALGTNKLQSMCGTALATWNYARAGLLPWRRWWPGMAMTFVAAMAGTATVTRLDPGWLRRLIPAVLGLVALYTAFKPDLGTEARPARMATLPFGMVLGALLGFYDGFLGPGTGSFWMVACVVMQGLDLRAATGVTKAMNLTSNLASLGCFMASGSVHAGIGLVMASGQVIGAYLGSRLAIKAGAKVIRPVFLTVVLALTAKLGWEALR